MNELNFAYAAKLTDLAFVSSLDTTLPIGIDIETASDVRPGEGALEPYDGHISTIQLSDGLTTIVVDAQEIGIGNLGVIADIIANPNILKIAHNAKFEIKWFIYHLGIEPESFFDTMLASQLIAAGDVSAKHDLDSVSRVFTSVELDKGEQTSDWSVRPLSESQLRYAAWDAAIVVPIQVEQVVRLIADDLTRVATIEFDSIKPIGRTELNGFHLDAERWSALLVTKKANLATLHAEMLEMLQKGVNWTTRNTEKHSRAAKPVKPKKPVNPKRAAANKGREIGESEMAEYEAQLATYEAELIKFGDAFAEWEKMPSEIPAVLNPSSHDQIKKVLFNVTGLKLASTREDKLLPFVDKFPEIAKLLEYRGADKSVSSYGDNFLALADANSRVHTSFKQILDTGRMSSSKPNIQQIPHDEDHRRCFTAPPGRKLVIADWAQIELRILAEMAQDPTFLADFNSDIDLHVKGASRFMGMRVEDVTKELRHRAKRTNFGVVYGIQGNKLGAELGIEPTAADKLIELYFLNYPENKLWLDKADHQARLALFARTMTGRLQRFSHDGGWGQISGVGRNGMNMPIQGSSADMLKRALYLLDLDLRGTTALMVNIVHDEIVVECDTADVNWVSEKLIAAMETAGRELVKVVKIEVEALAADEWVKE